MKIFNRRILVSEKELQKDMDLLLQKERQELSVSVKAAMNVLLQMQNIVWSGVTYTDYNIEQSFKSAFTENAVFFSIVDKEAKKFAHIPRSVYKSEVKAKRASRRYQTKALDENIADGDLMQLLLAPNTYEGQDAFFYKVAVSYISTGEAFIWKNRGVPGSVLKPIELYVLPPWCVTIVSDGSLFGVKEYKLTVAGTDTTIPKTDILHWKNPALALDQQGSQLRAFNPLQPSKKVLSQSDSIVDASVSMYQKGGARGVLFNKDLADIDEQQKEAIKSVIDRKVNNTDVKGAVAALQGEWGYLNIGSSSVDMELLKAEEAVIKKICFLLGYPYEMYSGDATHANREQSMEYLLTQTIAPMVASFDAELNRSLLPDFKEKGFVQSDMSELPEMQQMRLKTAIAVNQMDYISPNEKRELGGWEARPEPEMDEIWVKTGSVPMSEASIGQPIDNSNAGDYNA